MIGPHCITDRSFWFEPAIVTVFFDCLVNLQVDLQVVADENERCPVVGMLKGIGRWLSGDNEANASAIRRTRRFATEGFCVFIGKLAFEELFLDGLEGDRFGGVGLGEVGVKVFMRSAVAGSLTSQREAMTDLAPPSMK